MPIFYDPPYDSPLEDEFARNLDKYLSEIVDLQKQAKAQTICGLFIIDFVIKVGQYRVGIECDGTDFHDISRDEWRDAMILGAGEVDVMYHFPGKGIHHNLEDCLYILAKLEPQLFNDRGHLNLETLATNTARRINPSEIKDVKEIILVYYDLGGIDPVGFQIFRRSLKDHLGFWNHAYKFAKQSGSNDLDEIMQMYRTRNKEEDGAKDLDEFPF